MGDVVNARAAQAARLQDVDGFMPIAAALFEISGGRPRVAMSRPRKSAIVSPVQA